MEYRRLGGSGLRVPALSFGTGTFGGGGEFFKAWGTSDAPRRAAGRHLPRGRAHHVRLGRRLLGRRRGDPGPGDQGPPRPGAHLDQGHVPHRRRAQRRRLVAVPPDPARSRRACGGWAPTTSTSTSCTPSTPLTPVEEMLAHARRPGARRQDPLHRLLELLRLAPDEVAGGLGDSTAWPRYVAHQAYYSLIGRDYEWELMPLALDQERRRGRLEPAGLGPADRQDPPRPAAAAEPAGSRARSRPTSGRRSPTSISTGSSTPSTRSPRRPARPCRRSRSTGCCSGRPWRT